MVVYKPFCHSVAFFRSIHISSTLDVKTPHTTLSVHIDMDDGVRPIPNATSSKHPVVSAIINGSEHPERITATRHKNKQSGLMVFIVPPFCRAYNNKS